MRLLGRIRREHRLRLLILNISDRCDQRCAHCHIWERDHSRRAMALGEWLGVVDDGVARGVEAALFTGGEPLLSPLLWPVADRLRDGGARLMLATNGMLLERHADAVERLFAEVYVSLEGASPSTHDNIRGAGAFDQLARGLNAIRGCATGVVLTARTTLHSRNLHEVDMVIETARRLGFHHVSFLPLDAFSPDFGENPQRRRALVPAVAQVDAFEASIGRMERAGILSGAFVSEDAEKLRRLARHLKAAGGVRPFERPECDAPRWSCVVESDGSLRPCFFHEAVGDVREGLAILRASASYREALDRIPSPNATCERCVCPKKGWPGLGSRTAASPKF